MKRLGLAFVACLAFFPAGAAHADQWGSAVMAECYDGLTGGYREHMFVRVFYTDVGRSLLRAPDGRPDGIFRLDQLALVPFSCTINGKVDLPGFGGERLAHFPRLSLERDGALEAER